MARHVLEGELPAFFWGQSYKGVPETYVAARGLRLVWQPRRGAQERDGGAVRRCTSPRASCSSDRWFGWPVAIGASVVAAVGPPALLYWTLSANAEFVLVMLIGTGLLLLLPAEGAGASAGRRLAFGVLAGLGAWTHPLIGCYLLPLALVGLLRSEWWRVHRSTRLLRAVIVGRAEGRPRPVVLLLNATALAYAGLGIAAFVIGRIDVSVAGLVVSAHHPQKMAAIAALCVLVSLVTVTHGEFRGVLADLWRDARHAAAGFLIGYVPVIVHALSGGRVGAPLRSMDLDRLQQAIPAMVRDIPAILSGVSAPTTDRLPLPAALVAPAVLAFGLYLWDSRGVLWDTLTLRAAGRPPRRGLLAGVPGGASGQRSSSAACASTRTRTVIWCRCTPPSRWPSCSGVAWPAAGGGGFRARCFLAVIVARSGSQQVLWFRTLTVIPCDRRMVACLKASGVRGGRADYWISYRLTFLSDEEVIMAPENGVDRYASYSAGRSPRWTASLTCGGAARRQPEAGYAAVPVRRFGGVVSGGSGQSAR